MLQSITTICLLRLLVIFLFFLKNQQQRTHNSGDEQQIRTNWNNPGFVWEQFQDHITPWPWKDKRIKISIKWYFLLSNIYNSGWISCEFYWTKFKNCLLDDLLWCGWFSFTDIQIGTLYIALLFILLMD